MGAEQLYKAYRESGLTLAEFEWPRYPRIGHIKWLSADGIREQQAALGLTGTARMCYHLHLRCRRRRPSIRHEKMSMT